ncbi:MAG: cytochrome c-type biogenesis protein CcmH [Gemmatimonadota bacterium]|nr:cytochrome c-type biogenesis protein CcmH [Gemmatimonadota bacterium]
MHRRDLLSHVAAAAVIPLAGMVRAQEAPAGGAQEGAGDRVVAPELYDPFRVGRPRDRITDYENDPFIVALESRMRCTCGCNLDVYTCRTTDFTCATSPAMHREVVQMVESGKTAQEVLDAFVAQHGEMVLMAPKKEGFNLLGYFLPGAAIALVGTWLVWALGRRRTAVAAVEARDGVDLSGLAPEDRAKLEAELSNLEL